MKLSIASLALLLLLTPSTFCAGQTLPAQGPAPAAPTSYLIQTGDTLEILYRNSPEFNQTVSVQPDGAVSLNLLGPVPIRGLSVQDAEARVTREAAKRLNEPTVSIVLKDFEKPHFTVIGEVNNPGRYELRGDLAAIDGLSMAGGLKISARHTKILLIHRERNVIKSTQYVDFGSLEKKAGSGTELLALRPDDILVIPTSKLSKLERYVKLANTGVYFNPINP